VYAPAFHGDWLWDDDQEITENPVLRDPGGLTKIWTGNAGADFFPLKTTIQWGLFRFLKTNKTGYHLVNVLLHLTSALLVWRLFERLNVKQAWLGGLLFCIHPILVESVAWISELKNTLSLPFLLLSMLAYIKFDERGCRSDYFWAVGLFLASILCKTSVVMYPFVVVLFCWWKRGRLGWSDILRSVPFFVVSLALGLITIHFQHDRAIGTETILVGGWASRTATAGMAVLFYLYKSIIPFGLLPIYPRWKVDPPTLVQFLPWPIMAGMLVWFWTTRKTWGRHALLGTGFFLLNVFPILGFITMSYMRITWVADHFVYLPAIGVIGLIVAGAGNEFERSRGNIRTGSIVVALISFTILIIASHRYAGIFADEAEMWSYTLKQNPSAWQAHSRYGKVMMESGNPDAAYHHIREAVRLRPDLAETHNNFASVLGRKGELDNALVELKEACRIAPDLVVYRLNLGKLLVLMKKFEEARGLYGELLKKEPENPIFLCNYGVALFCLDRKDEAIAKFEEILKKYPDFEDAKTNLEVAREKPDKDAKPKPMLPSAPDM